jgi:hypothetical protein
MKTMKTPRHCTKLIAVVAAMLMLAASQASAVIAIITPVGIAFGQTARVNILNLAERAIIINCKFVDSEGILLGESRATIDPGKTTSFDLNRDTLSRAQNRVQLYAVIESPQGNPKRVLTSLEVFNNADGRTTVFIGDPNIKTGGSSNREEAE